MKPFLVSLCLHLVVGVIINVQAGISQADSIVSENSSAQRAFEARCQAKSDLIVLENTGQMIPFQYLDNVETIAITYSDHLEWRKWLWRYQQINLVKSSDKVVRALNSVRRDSIRLVLLLDEISRLTADSAASALAKDLAHKYQCCLIYTGNPADLRECADWGFEAVILTQSNRPVSRDLSSQLLFGAIKVDGVLEDSICNKWSKGSGIAVNSLGRLTYTVPESVGMDGELINHKVDSIVNGALDEKAFPGCRVLVAVKGKVIFNKAYGYHTYHSIQKVNEHDVFDLASVTKITGPLPLLMKAKDEGLLELDQPFAKYWNDWQSAFLKKSNKSEMTVREVLTHQAGLQSYINYYPYSLKKGQYNSRWYQFKTDDTHTLQISDHLFLADKFKKVIYRKIRKSPVSDQKVYKYSGLSYMIYPELLEQLFAEDYQTMLYDSFFKPLGASSLCYNPLERMPVNRILPTEVDNFYRLEQVHGRVHDEAAAVMGGVSGNAGLFGTAHDLAKVMQMYLQMGEYAGQQYVSKATMREFSSVQYPDNNNRRGIGFDKPLFGNGTLSIEDSYPAPGVSPTSFGHSGFTGTFVWVDPQYELMYIFLSNRVYPTRENPKIYRMNIRPSIQQIFYDELKKDE